MAEKSISSREMSEELDHAHSFARISYAAFKFPRNRLKQWRLCTILFDKEEDWKIDEAALRRDQRVEDLIEHSAAVYYRIRSLLKSFGNHDGAFLTRVREDSKQEPNPQKGKQKSRIYKLNDHFDAAVDTYLSLFFKTELASGLPPTNLTTGQKRAVIKGIYKFQVEKYLPAWRRLLDCIGASAAKVGVNKERLMKELGSSVTPTAIIIVFFQQYLADPNKTLGIQDLPQLISGILGGWHPTEIPDALRFLSKENGCKVLVKERDKTSPSQWTYRFNDSYSDCLRAYCTELKYLRSEFAVAVRAHLNPNQGS